MITTAGAVAAVELMVEGALISMAPPLLPLPSPVTVAVEGKREGDIALSSLAAAPLELNDDNSPPGGLDDRSARTLAAITPLSPQDTALGSLISSLTADGCLRR